MTVVKPKKKPEIENILYLGSLEEVAVVVERLQTLPEYGMSRKDEEFARATAKLAELERAVEAAREEVRERAFAVYGAARVCWDASEIKEATGYST